MDADYNVIDIDGEASDEDFEDAHESFGAEEDMFESDIGPRRHKQQPLSKHPFYWYGQLVWTPALCALFVCVYVCVSVRGHDPITSSYVITIYHVII